MLILSVGYGQGHHSAAAAMAEYYSEAGWSTRVVDACEAASPRLFRYTQTFYRFCVRRAPWLWGVTYSLTDTADWAQLIYSPVMIPVRQYLKNLLDEWRPTLIICTYPLFAYMLDAMRTSVPYAIVVTDAQEISRPWMCSKSRLVIVPDDESARMVRSRYGLDEQTVVAAGFPVRRAFVPLPRRETPAPDTLRVLYGAYRRPGGVVADVAAMLEAFPGLQLTVLAGHHENRLVRVFGQYCRTGRLRVLRETERMHDLLAESHVYVGKAGAATLFECYSTHVPVIVNYTLPGQEQGNLQLLLQDGAGCHAESTENLVQILESLLDNHSEGWLALCGAMKSAHRSSGACRIASAIERRFGLR